MSACKAGVIQAGLLILLLLMMSSIEVWARSSYDELERILSEQQTPDTNLIQNLPEPRTAREYWLNSRVETSPERVKTLLREAINRTGKQAPWVRYMTDWVSVALLDDSSPEDIEFLRAQLDHRVGTSSGNGALWLKSARLCRYLRRPELARTYYKQAMADSDFAPPALLGLAELSMEESDFEQAHEYLEEYLLEYPNQPRPDYWLLKGQLFERTGSDSEARVAYRHILEQYPQSIARDAAQQRLDELGQRVTSLPDSATAARAQQQPATSSTAVQGPTYAVQIGSFRDRGRAERLRGRARRRLSRRIVIEPAMVRGDRFFRVIIPGFGNQGDARAFLQRLKGMGFRGFIRKNYHRDR